jgi:lipopolysaccharide export system ATP-binding protein
MTKELELENSQSIPSNDTSGQPVGVVAKGEVSSQSVPGQKESVLRSDGIFKRYKKRYVVKDVSVEVKQGEVVGLLGPNGAGKTTTFYMIVGMIRPTAGKVFLDGQEITKLPMYKRARLGIGYLPQEASIFRRLTVRENIMAVLQMMGLEEKERAERCDRLLAELGVSSVASSKAYVLSGGERRRTEIARALAFDPKFILLDEPFAGIDPIAVEDLMNIVHSLKDRNIGVLVTDHNVHETLHITDRAYLLFEGRILKSGTAEFLANDPEARKLYLGERFRLDRY